MVHNLSFIYIFLIIEIHKFSIYDIIISKVDFCLTSPIFLIYENKLLGVCSSKTLTELYSDKISLSYTDKKSNFIIGLEIKCEKFIIQNNYNFSKKTELSNKN